MAVVLNIFGLFFTIAAIIAAVIYFNGVPAEWKKEVVEKLAEKEGEHEAAGILKDQLKTIPESDQKTANSIQKGLGALTGGDLKNPLGNL